MDVVLELFSLMLNFIVLDMELCKIKTNFTDSEESKALVNPTPQTYIRSRWRSVPWVT